MTWNSGFSVTSLEIIYFIEVDIYIILLMTLFYISELTLNTRLISYDKTILCCKCGKVFWGCSLLVTVSNLGQQGTLSRKRFDWYHSYHSLSQILTDILQKLCDKNFEAVDSFVV